MSAASWVSKDVPYVAELLKTWGINLADFGHKGNGCEQYTMIAVREEVLRLRDEMIGEVWDFANHAKGT